MFLNSLNKSLNATEDNLVQTRNIAMKHFIIDQNNIRLDKYIKSLIPGVTQAIIEKFLRKKLITIESNQGKEKAKSSSRLQQGQNLYIHTSLEQSFINKGPLEETPGTLLGDYEKALIKEIKKAIIYENENIIILNKPFGIPVQSGKYVRASIDQLMKHIPGYEGVRVAHRLDKHTTGALLLAKNLEAAKELMSLFQRKEIKKKYIALLIGRMKQNSGLIKSWLKKAVVNGEEIMQSQPLNSNSHNTREEFAEEGELAITKFQILEKNELASLVELSPITGKKHQLRAHMLSIGHPILSDGKYGRRAAFLPGCNKSMCLHAQAIEFILFGQKISIAAALPYHIKENMKKLNFSSDIS